MHIHQGNSEIAYYRKVPKVTTLVTFEISSLWGSLILGDRYFRGVITFREQKSLNKIRQVLFLNCAT